VRPARLLVLSVVVILALAGCGGGQATSAAEPGTLLSQAGAAASGKHSARFQILLEGTIVHRHPLPAGTSAGPYGISVRGAATGAGGGMTDVTVGIHEPGATMSYDIREIGTTLYVEAPGGQRYSEGVGGLAAQSPQPDRASGVVGIRARRAGRADAIDGELDPVAISADVARLLRQLHVPRRDLALAR
jgi:hypothetical protein